MRAGIGHVTRRYAESVGAEYCELGYKPKDDSYDICFSFILPLPWQIIALKMGYMPICKKTIVMAVCETETVHEWYANLLEFQPVYCPSEFSRKVFQRQFGGDWRLLRHFTPDPPLEKTIVPNRAYVFYTIGNVLDYRKNIKMLLEAFIRLDLPNCILVLKSTTAENQRVPWKFKNVHIIEDLLTDDDLNRLHDSCDCYVNCSFSEGVGMGAVEAAVRDKPVIISGYGGLQEYVKTPYVIETKLGPVGKYDALFIPEMIWGHPSLKSLMDHMKTCYDLKLTYQDHSYTRSLNDDVLKFFRDIKISDSSRVE